MAFKFNPFTGNMDVVVEPAGSDTQIQYNNAGVFGGDADLAWDYTFNVLRVGVADSGAGDIIANGTYFKFHGNKQHEILVENSLSSASLVVTGGGNAASFVDIRSTYGTGSSDYIRLATGSNGSNEGLRVISSGKVGINTSTPAAQLSVNGGAHIGGTTDPGDNNLLVDGTATVDGHLILTTPGVIRTSTSDGADNGAINITGGGAFGSSRGAGFSIGGNEDASIPGSVQYTLGNVANAFLSIVSPVGAGSIFYDGDTGHTAIDSLHVGGATDPGDNNLLVDGTITASGNVSVSEDIIFTGTNKSIHQSTSDGSDNRSILMGGGGAIADSRGAYFALYGNEHATLGGHVGYQLGAVAGAEFNVSVGGGASGLKVNASGNVSTIGTLEVGGLELVVPSGDIGVGTSAPNVGGFSRAFTVRADADGTVVGTEWIAKRTSDAAIAEMAFANIVGSTPDYIALIRVSRSGANDAGSMSFLTQATGGSETVRLNISSTGIHTMSAYGAGAATFDANGVISSVSDLRKKERVVPYTDGLDAIRQLEPIRYNWKEESGSDPARNYVGFGAQDVLPWLPDAVDINRKTGDYSFNPHVVIAALVNAVQTLADRLDAIEGRDRTVPTAKTVADYERIIELDPTKFKIDVPEIPLEQK